MPKFEDPIEAINGLGADTADGVAAALKKLGIRGKIGECCHCPIANLIRNAGFIGPEVSEGEIVCQMGELDYIYIPPKYVAEFITLFDQGEYPELVEA